jgi:hypothetical protein
MNLLDCRFRRLSRYFEGGQRCPNCGTSLLTSAFMLHDVNAGHPNNRPQLIGLSDADVTAVVDREMNPPFGRLDAMAGGVARVAKGRLRAHGECSCGWRGAEHVLSAVAVHDALMHAAVHRCEVGVPLMM